GLTTASAPAGVTTTCVPSSLTGNASSTCTLTAPNPGAYTVTITGTNGSVAHDTLIDATATTPDFCLSASPNSVPFAVTDSATSTIQLQSTGGFNGPVDLTAESSPSGLSTSCTPSTLQGSDTSTCTIDGSVPGTYAVIVTGTNGRLVHNATIAVTVEPQVQPDFSLYTDPNSVSFLAGESTTAIVGIVSSGGFAGPVDLTAASVPGGI